MELGAKFDSADAKAGRKALALARVDQKQERLRPLDVDNAPDPIYDQLNFCVDLGLFGRTRGARSA
jgi:hypothetical protein